MLNEKSKWTLRLAVDWTDFPMVYPSYSPAEVGVSERSVGLNRVASQKDRTKKDKLIDYVCYIWFSTLPGNPNSLKEPYRIRASRKWVLCIQFQSVDWRVFWLSFLIRGMKWIFWFWEVTGFGLTAFFSVDNKISFFLFSILLFCVLSSYKSQYHKQVSKSNLIVA
jgi:hypothetical protein